MIKQKNNRQQRDSNNLTNEQLRNDTDMINAACDLYDKGVTIDLLKMMFADIERYREQDE